MNTISHPGGHLRHNPAPRAAPTAVATPGTRVPGMILSGLLIFLKWLIIAILVALTALLVGISFAWGPTAPLVAGLLGVAGLGLLAGLGLAARRYRSGRATFAAVAGFAVLALLTVESRKSRPTHRPLWTRRGG